MTAQPGPARLHKVLAHAGVASRRKCEELIRDGRVRVNGAVVREMGVRVDPAKDVVEVDDARIRPERLVHLLVYKPRDYLCTTSDQYGRKTILDLLPHHRGTRLFTVGRLDQDAEGLVVVTNDGDFAHALLHPRRRLPRTYFVKVRGNLTQETVAKAREGVWLADGRTPPMDVHLVRAGREVSSVKCTLVERHHHQLRRIWAKLGAPVLRLVLVRIGPIGTEALSKGRARPLTADEVEELRSGPPGGVGHAPRPGARARKAPAERDAPAARSWGAPARGAASRGAARPRAPEGQRPRRSSSRDRLSSSSGRRSRKRGL